MLENFRANEKLGVNSSHLEKEERRPWERGCITWCAVASFSDRKLTVEFRACILIFSLTCGKGRKCHILAKYVAKRELKDVENVTECSTALFSASEKIGRATKRHATRASKQLQALQTTTTPTNCPRQFLVVRLHSKSLFFM